MGFLGTIATLGIPKIIDSTKSFDPKTCKQYHELEYSSKAEAMDEIAEWVAKDPKMRCAALIDKIVGPEVYVHFCEVLENCKIGFKSAFWPNMNNIIFYSEKAEFIYY